MTHRAWVESARPEAPRALTARVVEVLGAHPEWEALPVTDALTLAGEWLLESVMTRDAGDARDRATALDLLAADACVTWAFEVAATDPDQLPERARQVMMRIFSSQGAAQ